MSSNTNTAFRSISIAVQAGTPTVLWGGPGTGKTSWLNSLGRALNVQVFQPIIASIYDPQTFGGFEVPGQDGFTDVQVSGLFRELAKSTGMSILFLDEISTAPPAVQAACLRLVFERAVGHYTLPDEVRIVAAANPPEEAANGWVLAPPMANRFFHYDWNVDAFNWTEGVLSGWPEPSIDVLPTDWEVGIPESVATVAGFIRSRPAMIYALPQDEDKAGKAWPSPRTWEQTARLLAAAQSVNAAENVVNNLTIGSVGEQAGMEFLNWRQELDLPNPEDLLKNPSKMKLPQRGDRQFVVLSSVVAYTIRNKEKKAKEAKSIYDSCWEILARAAEQGAKDVAVVSARTLAKNMPSGYTPPLANVAPFTDVLKLAGIRKKGRK